MAFTKEYVNSNLYSIAVNILLHKDLYSIIAIINNTDILSFEKCIGDLKLKYILK